MSTFTGGKLKLKGGAVKPGGKKRKSKKGEKALQAAMTEETSAVTGGEKASGGDAGASGSRSAPDRRTPAERKLEEHRAKYEAQRVALAASKSHRERVAEMNEKLANLTEHHDLFRVSYTA